MIIEELIALLGFDLEGEGDLKRFAEGLQGAERNAQKAAKSIGVLGVAVGSFVGAMAAQAVYRLGDMIGSLPGDILATGSQFEALGIRLETLEGSSQKAEAALDWIREFAANTPLDLAQAADAYANLRNYGLDPTAGSLQAMVDAMSASGKGVGQLDRLVLALGQAWTKTKLQGGEILQLTEAGIPVWQMLADATGKSIPQLQKLSEAGKLGRKEIQLLIDAIGKKYTGASEKFAKSFAGVTDKIGEQWTEFKKRVADAGFFNWFKDRANGLLDVLEKWEKDGTLDWWARTTSRAFTAVGDALVRLWRSVVRLGSWIGKGFDALGKSMADGLRWLSGGNIDLSNMEALAAAAALVFAYFFPLGAVVVAAGLAIDDFLAYLEGGDSVIGGWVAQLPSLTKAFDDLLPGVRSAVQSMIALLQEGDWAGAGIMAVEAYSRYWSALSGLIKPYLDQAVASAMSVDWSGLSDQIIAGLAGLPEKIIPAIGAALAKAFQSLGSIDTGSLGSNAGTIGTEIGVAIGAALVAGLITQVKAVNDIFAGIARGLINLDWSSLGSGLLSALRAQVMLINGIFAGIAGQIIATIQTWFDIDLTGIGVKMANSLLAGLQSLAPSIRAWFDSLLPAWAQGFVGDLRTNSQNAAAADAGDRVGAMVNQLQAVSGDRSAEAVGQTIANDNRVLNQSNTVNAPVTVNATVTNATPAAIGAAAGAGVRGAGDAAVRSLGVTGLPSFGGPR